MKINYGNIEQWAQRLREVFVPSQELASVRRRREEAKKTDVQMPGRGRRLSRLDA